MNALKISVIVPVYNVEKYIKRCVESILAQTVSDFELILVNDGSTDSTLEICQSYAHDDCRVSVLNKSRGGVSSARNLGLKIAKGDWIAFIDADDWIDNGYLEALLKNSLHSDFVISGFQYVLQQDGKLENSDVITASLSPMLSYDELFCLPHLMSTPWGKLFSASLIREHSLMFDEKMKMGEDTCFVCSYLCHTRNVCFTEYAGYKYLYGAVAELGVKYKMSTSDFVYHFTHIVGSLERVSQTFGISMDNSIENEKKFFFHLYIEILKHLGYGELNGYVKEMQHLGILQFLPQSMSPKKVFLLKTAHFCPLIFFALIRILKLLRT